MIWNMQEVEAGKSKSGGSDDDDNDFYPHKDTELYVDTPRPHGSIQPWTPHLYRVKPQGQVKNKSLH